ncbi:MAG: RagB/SusD family nutrient uptake outer membrane protein [Chitinophagaceae bacterium]|nr:RagB/SusD family nutrient uptake outer membrane protein [Chitinophagaceae bacterium]
MKNTTTLLLAGGGLAVALLSACSKKDLTIPPTIPIVTVDNYFQTETQAIAGINAAYTPLSAIYNGAAWHIGDIMSDDTDLGGGGGGDGLETAELDNFNVTSFNPIINLMWAQNYFGILRCNLVLEKVPTIPVMSATLRTRILGEARFLRALYYWHLVRVFGDVPLYTRVISVEESTTITRSPRADVFKQIIADLQAAETALPVSYSGSDMGRATRGAAKGLLAAVYLWLGDKPNAAAKAKEVIDANTYRLNADYADNFSLDRENGPESVFEVQYRSGGGQWSDFGAGHKLNTFFAPRGQQIVQSDGYGWNVPTRDLAEQYERTGTSFASIIDRRRARSMWIPGDRFETYVQPAQLIGSPLGLNVRKYFVPIANTLGDNGGWTCALNVPIMRYSEILLIYAEAAGPTLGKPFADQVRARAGLAPLPNGLNDAQYLAAIYKERRIEFAFEMHRWYDLLRHPDPNYFITVMRAHGKTNVQPRHRFMPIPQGERDKNPNLTQNEGY